MQTGIAFSNRAGCGGFDHTLSSIYLVGSRGAKSGPTGRMDGTIHGGILLACNVSRRGRDRNEEQEKKNGQNIVYREMYFSFSLLCVADCIVFFCSIRYPVFFLLTFHYIKIYCNFFFFNLSVLSIHIYICFLFEHSNLPKLEVHTPPSRSRRDMGGNWNRMDDLFVHRCAAIMIG